MRRQLARVVEAHRGDELGERVHGVLVVAVDALGLVGTTSARCSFGFCVVTPTGQAFVLQRWAWMQPTENMNARAELHQSAPSASAVAIAEPVTILPLAPSLIWSRMPAPTSVLCDEREALQQREAHRVRELLRRRAGAAFAAVDDDEVGVDAGLDHRLDDAHELARLADADLEADRLAAAELAQLA